MDWPPRYHRQSRNHRGEKTNRSIFTALVTFYSISLRYGIAPKAATAKSQAGSPTPGEPKSIMRSLRAPSVALDRGLNHNLRRREAEQLVRPYIVIARTVSREVQMKVGSI